MDVLPASVLESRSIFAKRSSDLTGISSARWEEVPPTSHNVFQDYTDHFAKLHVQIGPVSLLNSFTD